MKIHLHIHQDCSNLFSPDFSTTILISVVPMTSYISHWPKNLNPLWHFLQSQKSKCGRFFYVQKFCCASNSGNWKDGVIIMAQGKRIHKYVCFLSALICILLMSQWKGGITNLAAQTKACQNKKGGLTLILDSLTFFLYSILNSYSIWFVVIHRFIIKM